MPQGNPEGYRYQRRPRHDSDESTELLKLALLEQEQTRPGSSQFRPGETPSNLAINAYLSTIPLSREQNREADVLDEMDRRYFQSREDRRAIDSQLEAQKGGATARQFAMRRGVEEDPSMLAGSPDPSQMRTIRRFSESARPVDPDAAMTASQRALIDPRVIAADITAQGRLAAEKAKADAKAEIEKAKKDAADAKAADVDRAAADERASVVALAEEIKKHPAMRRNVGSIDSRLPTWFGDSAEFDAKRRQLLGKLTLENIGKMKGTGPLSDRDLQAIQSAATALDVTTDEASFQRELDNIIAAVRQRGGAASATGGGAEFDFVPGKGLVPRAR